MKVSELVELLKELPQEAPIMTASDEEGNSFHHLTFFSFGYVEKAQLSTYEPEVCFPDDEENDEYEGDSAYTEVFILYP